MIGAALVLCNDRPETFGAPDVLEVRDAIPDPDPTLILNPQALPASGPLLDPAVNRHEAMLALQTGPTLS